ncbi:MAG: LysE/ArgO family amino acid transporter [Paracoccaceae bacterium]
MPPFVAGYLLSLSLIVAIGAQNAFVLRQGLRRQHVLAIVTFCTLADAVLIAAGVLGFGRLVDSAPWLEPAMRYGGAAFLVLYGWQNARSAWRGGTTLEPQANNTRALLKTIASLAAITFLNPHVYLDTLVLVGSIGAQYNDPWAFIIGASLGSMTFFIILGYGARLLDPLFRTPKAWQVLDGLVAATMWILALGLILT